MDIADVDVMSLIDDDVDDQAQLYEHYRVVADKGQKLLRVDRFLIDHLGGISVTECRRLLMRDSSW